jgi:hypothetical protein
MKKRRRKSPTPLPLMLTELALASWATIAHRTALMAKGSCTPAEYSRMVLEKAAAARDSATLLTRRKSSPRLTSIVAPWHKRAVGNARRLRRR